MNREFRIHHMFEKRFPELAERCRKNNVEVFLRKGRRRDMLGLPTWHLSYRGYQVSGFKHDSPEHTYTIETLQDRLTKVLDRLEAGRAEVAKWSREKRALHVLDLLEGCDFTSHWRDPKYRAGAWYNAYHDSGDYAHALVNGRLKCVGVHLWDENDEIVRVADDDDLINLARKRVSEMEDAA